MKKTLPVWATLILFLTASCAGILGPLGASPSDGKKGDPQGWLEQADEFYFKAKGPNRSKYLASASTIYQNLIERNDLTDTQMLHAVRGFNSSYLEQNLTDTKKVVTEGFNLLDAIDLDTLIIKDRNAIPTILTVSTNLTNAFQKIAAYYYPVSNTILTSADLLNYLVAETAGSAALPLLIKVDEFSQTPAIQTNGGILKYIDFITNVMLTVLDELTNSAPDYYTNTFVVEFYKTNDAFIALFTNTDLALATAKTTAINNSNANYVRIAPASNQLGQQAATVKGYVAEITNTLASANTLLANITNAENRIAAKIENTEEGSILDLAFTTIRSMLFTPINEYSDEIAVGNEKIDKITNDYKVEMQLLDNPYDPQLFFDKYTNFAWPIP